MALLETPTAERRPSVFVVALPRSLSTLVYHLTRLSLGLETPSQVTDGEILNPDRLIPGHDPAHGLGCGHRLGFQHPRSAPGPCREIERSLSRLVRPRGFAYKDVVQPFAVARWLARRDLPVLKIHRPLADVALAMLGRGWCYPAAAAWLEEGPQGRFLEGLVRAEAALTELPGEPVLYDEMVVDDSSLQAALDRLAGGRTVERHRYLDDEFRRRRDEILARRDTSAHRRLETRIGEIRRRLAATEQLAGWIPHVQTNQGANR